MRGKTASAFALTLFLLSVASMAMQGNKGRWENTPDERFLQFGIHVEREIEWDKMAIKKSSNPEVRKVAQMIIDDLTKGSTELKALAAKEGIPVLPEEDEDPNARQAYQDLKQMMLNSTWDRSVDFTYLSNTKFKGIVAEYGREAHRQAPGSNSLKAYAQKMWPILMKDEATVEQAAGRLYAR